MSYRIFKLKDAEKIQGDLDSSYIKMILNYWKTDDQVHVWEEDISFLTSKTLSYHCKVYSNMIELRDRVWDT